MLQHLLSPCPLSGIERAKADDEDGCVCNAVSKVD